MRFVIEDGYASAWYCHDFFDELLVYIAWSELMPRLLYCLLIVRLHLILLEHDFRQPFLLFLQTLLCKFHIMV